MHGVGAIRGSIAADSDVNLACTTTTTTTLKGLANVRKRRRWHAQIRFPGPVVYPAISERREVAGREAVLEEVAGSLVVFPRWAFP